MPEHVAPLLCWLIVYVHTYAGCLVVCFGVQPVRPLLTCQWYVLVLLSWLPTCRS
jgi:hypothetical protein